ncbi:MAG: alpha/beta hydrolase [Opitutae bacterium]|nr:alpha/beta hydrolase [Opitutae bacterium]
MTVSPLPLPAEHPVFHRTVTVRGLEIFYREAGAPTRPTVLLLHGFPTSSHMFRNLIPGLAADFHVIAPDYPGFGQSSAPGADEFAYTFDHLTDVLESFLVQLGVTRFALFMQDYGAPVGFRLATRHPDWVRGLIVQNANAYVDGLGAAFEPLKPFWAQRTPETELPVRTLLTPASTRFLFLQGARRPEVISPDTWVHAQAGLDRPGNDRIQLALLHDFRNNPPRYAEWHAYFRRHQPPTLIAWGRHDPVFAEAGARAFLRDLPAAALHLFETGHFALEEDGAAIADLARAFLRRLP